ncbi:MAG: diphthine--ammonia ligase [Gemmatimonadota bacterium]
MSASYDSYAVAWSGGKDSAHALHRARRGGYPVTCLLNLYDGASGRVRFHGVRQELIAAQAHALGCSLHQRATGRDDFEAVFLAALEELRAAGMRGVVFGNIHLADVREWYETRTRRLGLDHVEPLWGEDPGRLAREAVEAGIRATIVSVDLAQADAAWLGCGLSEKLIREMEESTGADPCGEHGEYHTFVHDGPDFRWPLRLRAGDIFEAENHRLLDLILDPEARSAGPVPAAPVGRRAEPPAR